MSRTSLSGLVAGLLFAAVLTGCASATARSKSVSAGAAKAASVASGDTRPRSLYSYPATQTAENMIASRNDMMKTPDALAARLGLQLRIPARLGDAALRRSYVNKKGVLPDLGEVEYEGHRFVHVWPMRDSVEASQWLADWDGTPDFKPYVKTLKVGSFDARAMDKLQVPPVDNADGTKVVGTGIYTSGARVRWTIGRFGIEVADVDTPLSELLPAVLEWGSK